MLVMQILVYPRKKNDDVRMIKSYQHLTHENERMTDEHLALINGNNLLLFNL